MSVLIALAVLAVIGLLFAMDPGGVIAESGFPDFQEMDWKQLVVWGFRTIGVVLAQLIIIVLGLWPRYRPPRASTWYSGTPRPGSMPAAAVSTLEGHMIWSPTTLASIIEMCQRGTLRIEPVGTRVGFLYRLSRQGLTQSGWERTICDSLPAGPTTIDALDEAIRTREDAIGDQLGDYLQQRGLFDDNPVRVRRQNTDDGGSLWMLACILTGIGGGLWAALWLDQWWANAPIGLFAGLAYSFFTVPGRIRTGMLKPTPVGVLEIGQWLGWKESIAGSALLGARNQSDPMLPYAVAFDVAQPWLDVAASAPPWFGPPGESSWRGVELDVAYRAFLHAPQWYLSGRSEDAAKAAAQWGYEVEFEALGLDAPDASGIEEIAGEPEAQSSFLDAVPPPPSAGYQQHTTEGPIDEPKSGGCLCGCLKWAVGLVGIGVVALLVLFSFDVVSPRDKPCSLDSPPVPTPAQLASIGDLFRDECVRVRGTVVSQDVGELVVEIDRGEYLQRVNVLDPSEVLQSFSPDRTVTLAGWLRVEEDGTYEVHFIPDYGYDREWWRNLRDNLEALF